MGRLHEEVVAIEFLVLPVRYNAILHEAHTCLTDFMTSVNKYKCVWGV